MPDNPSFVGLTRAQRAELEAFASASGSGWHLVSQSSIPTAFPEAFRKKIDSAVLIVSGSPSGTTYLMFNALRVDNKAGLIDQEPFAVAVTGSQASIGGVFVHHGSWPSRSFSPPADFWATVQASGVGNYFLANPPSGKSSGSLDELPLGSAGAWNAVIQHVISGSTQHR